MRFSQQGYTEHFKTKIFPITFFFLNKYALTKSVDKKKTKSITILSPYSLYYIRNLYNACRIRKSHPNMYHVLCPEIWVTLNSGNLLGPAINDLVVL